MKLTLYLSIAIFLQAKATSYSQSVTISGNNLSLKQVFAVVKKQTGYVLFVNREDLAKGKAVSVSANNMPLGDFMQLVLKDQPLNFIFRGNTIVLSAKPVAGENASRTADPGENISPQMAVEGRVTDAEKKPMKGVSVIVRGTDAGTQTDESGYFKLNVKENAVLEFSFLGYGKQTYKVNGTTRNIFISLSPEAKTLNEMVMVGYGATRRKDLTGSVASVDVNEVKNTPFVSIDQALAGKATGVQVIQADGSPGGMAKIRIRGGTSLIGGNDPLYIIDGVQVTIQNRYVQSGADLVNPVETLGDDVGYAKNAVGSSFARGLNTLAGLNINDIESIDILKDASATAIYGSRAANGVVIITTKKGKKNEKPILEANYYTGLSKAITEKLLNASQYKSVMLEGAQNLNALRASQSKPADAIATSIINNPDFLGTANTNWLDLVTRTGITHNADISVRGGGSGSRYYTSLSYTKQTGTLLGTDFSRIAGKINLDNEITPKLRVITNLDYAFTKNNVTNGLYSSAIFAPPTFAPFNADGTPAVFDPATFAISAGSGIQNPMALLQGINTSKNALLLGSIALEYDIFKTLKFRSTASVNYTNYHQLNYIPSSLNIADPSGVVSSDGGIASQAQTQQSDVFYENTLTWDKQFNDNNRLNLLVGTSWQKTNTQTFSASGQGFPDDQFLNGLSSAALALPPKASETQSSLLSYYLRANYALNERYLFTVTARSDESSKFPKSNRVSYFPSFGVAWRANEEPFLKGATWLNELKFRASAGYTGTQNLGNNLFYTLFTPGSYASTNALIPTQLGNDHIKWETTLQKDAGVDFALFNSRLRGAIGYYHKKTTDLLLAYNVATSSGFTSALVNVADITNKGLEIDLRADIIRKKDWGWSVSANVSGNRSTVTRINQDLQNPQSTGYSDPYYNSVFSIGNTVLREGEPIGLIYGYEYKGVIKTEKELEEYKAESIYAKLGLLQNLALGYPKYGLIDTGVYKGYFKRDVIGSAQPKFYGGVSNTFSYKQFSVIALLTYSCGGDILYLPDVNALGLGDRGNRNTRILLPHYSAGNTDADRPSLLLKESNTYGTGSSSATVHDASYIKLKSISINYQLPDKLLNKLHLRTALVYVSGSNLFCITGYPGPDPEVSNDPYSLISGYTDAAAYPSMRQYTFGMRIGF
ncbi:TonB-dependent receptor [Chitinophaga sp. ARDCPP14]|uniref:TonB-dependent receptor n=1 Tax=Chitinophaga sp. ARDCPP14 TaxID=3391139 RepID=UPI003F51FF39